MNTKIMALALGLFTTAAFASDDSNWTETFQTKSGIPITHKPDCVMVGDFIRSGKEFTNSGTMNLNGKNLTAHFSVQTAMSRDAFVAELKRAGLID